MKTKTFFTISILLSVLAVVLADFGFTLYKDREHLRKLTNKFSGATKERQESYFTGPSKDIEWAKRILNGGYIIFLRHTQRDKKWEGVRIYDLLEADVHNNGMNGTRYGEKDYFSGPVCLNSKGKVQAKAIGEHFRKIKFPVGRIVSSPSCRARQTAEIIFGRYDSLDKNLMSLKVYSQSKESRFSNLNKLFKQIPAEEGKNIIISAHGNVILPRMFDNPKKVNLNVDQGGMIILSRDKGKVKVEHSFETFGEFIRPFYIRK